jgi:hypothetical protein
MSWQAGFLRGRAAPGVPHRRWPRLRRQTEYDPKYDVLMECVRCKRKVGEGPLKAIRLWRVRHTVERRFWNGYQYAAARADEQGCPDSGTFAVVECADRQECEEYRASKERRQREQQERRRPKLPHADAAPGCCKWCGEGIGLDESKPGWKRRKQRNYHRGDEFELGDTDCFTAAMIWLDPKRGTQELLARQEGKCAECGTEIAKMQMKRIWDEARSDWTEDLRPWWVQGPDHPRIDIDHRTPIVDGGENLIENLQAICNTPCHKAKTAREAKARAAARKAGVEPSPEPNPDQLEMAA